MGSKKQEIPYSVKLSKNVELSKGILLFASGYVLCFMFLLDYSQEGMNIFYRWSTTSQAQFRHPILFALWCLLCAFSFLLNLDHLRRKHNITSKTVAVLQYLGFFFIFITMLVPTHVAPHESLSDYLYYYVHLISAIVYALSNMFALVGVFFILQKRDKQFRYWFFGSIAFLIIFIPLFAFKLSGFVETAATLVMFAVLYILNFTSIISIETDQKPKKQVSTKQHLKNS